MKRKTLEIVLQALNKNDIRYLIAGGLAVVFHGYARFTSDLDVIIDLDKNNLVKALKVFDKLGYKPRIPVSLFDFSNPDIRQSWIEKKAMTVFPLYHPEYQETAIDIFAKIPFNFDLEYQKAKFGQIAQDIEAPFISYEQLIRLKKIANRDIDKNDVRNLIKINKS